MRNENMPDGWSPVRLEATALREENSFKDGDWIESAFISEKGIRLVQTGNIGKGYFVERPDKKKFITEKTFEDLNCKWVYPGEILICRLASPIGRACRIPERIGPCVTAVDCTIYRPDPDIADSSFMLHLLNSEERLRDLQRLSGGSTRQRISRRNLGGTKVWLPPLPEQRRISEVLDTVDAAIQQTDEVIAKLKQVKAGLLQDLLTRGLDADGRLRNPYRHPEQFKDSPLGRISKEWDVLNLPAIASYQNGKAFPSGEYLQSAGIPLLRPGNLHKNGFVRWDEQHTTYLPHEWEEKASSYVVEGGEVVMNLTAQSLEDQFLGRVCLTPSDTYALLNQRLARFSATGCELYYLYWALKGPHFREQVDRIPTGTKIQHIYNKDLDSMRIAVPKEREEQRHISNTLFSHVTLITSEQSYGDKLIQFKSGLMKDLLTGRVRVPEAEEMVEEVA